MSRRVESKMAVHQVWTRFSGRVQQTSLSDSLDIAESEVKHSSSTVSATTYSLCGPGQVASFPNHSLFPMKWELMRVPTFWNVRMFKPSMQLVLNRYKENEGEKSSEGDVL